MPIPCNCGTELASVRAKGAFFLCVLHMECMRSAYAARTCSIWCTWAENRCFCMNVVCVDVFYGFCVLKMKIMLLGAKPFGL